MIKNNLNKHSYSKDKEYSTLSCLTHEMRETVPRIYFNPILMYRNDSWPSSSFVRKYVTDMAQCCGARLENPKI